MLHIVGIGKSRVPYPDQSTQEFMSLDDYLLAAKKAIKYFGPKVKPGLVTRLLKSEDAVSEVAHAMMIADWRYDPSKGMTRYNFRNNYAFYAVRILASNKTKKKSQSLDENHSYGEDVLNLYSYLYDEKNIDPLTAMINSEDDPVPVVDKCLDDGTLTDKQSKSVKMYYHDNMTLEAIGNVMGVTKERIRQNINNAIDKIKDKLNV